MPKPPQQRRTRRAVVKFSPQEWESTVQRAQVVRLRLGPFVRSLGIEKPLPRPRVDQEALAELRSAGNNLNRLARAMNQRYPVAERRSELVLELAAAAFREIAG
jgi:hypothetical protein